MATRAIAASAANVVRLPTAAPRKINNNRFREQRRAASALRKESAFTDRYIDPCVRAALPDARLFNEITLTPGLLIASTLLDLIEPEIRDQLVKRLSIGAAVGRKPHQQALMLIRRQRQCVGDEYAFRAALIVAAEEGF